MTTDHCPISILCNGKSKKGKKKKKPIPNLRQPDEFVENVPTAVSWLAPFLKACPSMKKLYPSLNHNDPTPIHQMLFWMHH